MYPVLPNALRLITGVAVLLLWSALPLRAEPEPEPSASTPPEETDPVRVLRGFPQLSKESATCMSCHREASPGIYSQWGHSKHFAANVGCYECHTADKSDLDAIMHKDFVIATIVSPKDCAQCHEREVAEFDASHHASAGNILGSLDNVLAEVVEGGPVLNGTSPVVTMGCAGCHGSIVKVNSDGTLDVATWPNTGVGRINPDGSKGACSACHLRHEFSVAQARNPDNCGRCHLGPDHPQKEIFEESAHGVAFRANMDRMNLDSAKWVVGEDYNAAPTCATCHMSRTKDLPVTHDIGDRISWNLRAPVSSKIDAKAKAAGKEVKSWIDRRKDMKSICQSCHGRNIADAHFEQLDAFVHLYNDKFAIPAKRLVTAMAKHGLRDPVKFNEAVEWTYFYLWHHEGRRARHGSAMFAPDYAHWEGMYEVAHRFYIEMVPEVRKAIEKARHEGNSVGADAVQALLDEILPSELHRWFEGGEPPKFWRPEDSDNHGFKVTKTGTK